MSKVMIVGAGKTGRGFLARLLREGKEEICFVDKDPELIRRLNEEKSFRIHFFGNTREAFTVDHYEACTWENASFDGAELILVSVGGQNLEDVGRELSQRLNEDRPYYIITCENASHPAETLKKAIGKENVFVSEATVFCTTIEGEGMDIHSENYPYLQYNAEKLGGYVPEAAAIKSISNFSDFLTRKLFTYNAASCVIAYLGWMKGYTNYGDAANDGEILELLDRNYAASNRALCREFGYDEKDQEEFAALSKAKFCDRTIVDTVARNARDPQRKLGANERIIGPLKLLHKYGEDASVLEMTAAAAILYQDEGETAWKKLREEKTPEQILTDVCGLEEGGRIYCNILKYVSLMEEGFHLNFKVSLPVKAALTACSDGLPEKSRVEMEKLRLLLQEMGIETVNSKCLYKQGGSAFSGSPEERVRELTRFYQDPEVKFIFDVSGGDSANGILPLLDYRLIRNSSKIYWGYSDLTTVINAVYAKTGKASVLYQVRNLTEEGGEEQREIFRGFLSGGSRELFQFSCEFLRGNRMEGVIIGGNIRCLLKLSGTEFWPDMRGKILLLEAMRGRSPQMAACLAQLAQMGVFDQVEGVLLGTFLEMEESESRPDIEQMVLDYAGKDLPVAKTVQIGHRRDSRGVVIGGRYVLRDGRGFLSGSGIFTC
ncbi:MAG TPA: LD-carboxypeptidase [Candidatus Blautia faecipullorum]|nr:LD-carboxypeptidase [Candidatus Blautia faecipullorum]